MHNLYRAFLTIVGMALCSGCASTAAGVTKGLLDKFITNTPSIDAIVEAGANINRDPNDRPSPVAIRIYELSSPDTFENASFHELYRQDETTLRADLVVPHQQLLVRPGEDRLVKRELRKDTRYLGVFAAFREYGSVRFHDTLELRAKKRNKMRILIDAQGVTIEPRT